MKLRKAQKEDLNRVADLYRSVVGIPGCTWNESYPGAFELEHDFRNRNLFVLQEGEQVIGAVSIVIPRELDALTNWRCLDKAVEIARVVIDRDHARKGLAQIMLEELFIRLKARGCEAIHLSVASCNPAAIRTYEKLEFCFLTRIEMYEHSYHLCERIL